MTPSFNSNLAFVPLKSKRCPTSREAWSTALVTSCMGEFGDDVERGHGGTRDVGRGGQPNVRRRVGYRVRHDWDERVATRLPDQGRSRVRLSDIMDWASMHAARNQRNSPLTHGASGPAQTVRNAWKLASFLLTGLTTSRVARRGRHSWARTSTRPRRRACWRPRLARLVKTMDLCSASIVWTTWHLGFWPWRWAGSRVRCRSRLREP